MSTSDVAVPAARLLIDGELVTGDGPSIDVIDPATGDVVTSISTASPEQIAAAAPTRG